MSKPLLVSPDPQDAASAGPEQSGPGGARSASTRLAFNGQFLEHWGCYPLGGGHRFYSPILMLFRSPDGLSPFGRGGINAYAYCSGDPVNAVDPTGRSAEEVMTRYILPGLTILSNFFLFRVAVGVVRNPNSSSAAVKASYFSGVGALVGAYGGVERILGNQEAMYIAGIGTAVSIIGSARRLRVTRNAEQKGWADLAQKDAAAASARKSNAAALESRSGRASSASATELPDTRPGTPAPIQMAPPLLSLKTRLASPASAPASLSRSIPATPDFRALRQGGKQRASVQQMVGLHQIRRGSSTR